jgi:sarcosine oxidase delta subunit
VKRDTVTYKIIDSYKFDRSEEEAKGSK